MNSKRIERHLLWLLPAALLALVPIRAGAVRGTTDGLITKAREAAAADRHREAIEYYHRALAMDSTLVSDLGLELGNQYTWADHPDSAVGAYEVYIASHPDDLDAKLGLARALSWSGRLARSEAYYRGLIDEGGDRTDEVLLGLAKVKSWQGDLAQAEHFYREILSNDSTDTDARLGLAEITNWAGRHRHAQVMYRRLVDEDPSNTDAVKGLAYAYYWAGRPDLALDAIADAPPSTEYEAAIRDIGQKGTFSGAHTYRYRDNTSDGDFQMFTSEFGYAPTDLSDVAFIYGHGQLTRHNSPDIVRDEFGARLQQRLSTAVAVTLNPGFEFNSFDPVVVPPNARPVDEFNLFIWDAYATVTPSDWVRIDVGTARQSIDIPVPVFRRIDVTSETAGLDWRLHRRLLTVWQLRYAGYSDTNSMVSATQRIDWTPPIHGVNGRTNLWVLSEGVELSDYRRQLDHGYFNPSGYVYMYGGLRFVSDAGRRVHVDLSGRYGTGQEEGAAWSSVGSYELEVRVKLAESAYLSGGYAQSGSRLESPDGFRSKGFFISLDYALKP